MYTGWQPPFSKDRGLNPAELDARLDRFHPPVITPDDAIAMTRFNSTFLEMVDRTFKIKGMFASLAGIGMLFAFLLAILVVPWQAIGDDASTELGDLAAVFIVFITLAVWSGFFWKHYLRKDMFQYTHYPVRFNRVTRKVYFFRHNGPDGVVVVPWDSPLLFFHVGTGGQNAGLHDLRCHLYDRNRQVQHTFTVGHFWGSPSQVHKKWALICRYMQNGPDHAFVPASTGVITLSTRSTLRNHWMMVCLMLGTALYPLRYTLMLPLYAALTAYRWLVFKSCKAPVFPDAIEAECAVAVDDPSALPEPRVMAEFASKMAARQRVRERPWQWNAHDSAMLLDLRWMRLTFAVWVLIGVMVAVGYQAPLLDDLNKAMMISNGFMAGFSMFLLRCGWGIRPSPPFQ